MLYNFLYPFRGQVPVLNVIQYITFRTAAASLTALAISLLLGPWLIGKLREFQIGQVIRGEGPSSHAPKAGTPTMGGLLILTAAIVPTLLWADLTNIYVWIAVLSTMAFGGIGFADDYLKIVRRSHHGLRPRYKIMAQVVVALAVGLTLIWLAHHNLYLTRLIFPFFKRLIPDLGWWYLPFTVVILVGWSNAVNLTDGLDGLAISTFAISAAAFTALSYVTGHRVLAQYLNLVHFETAELTIFCGALVGASLGSVRGIASLLLYLTIGIVLGSGLGELADEVFLEPPAHFGAEARLLGRIVEVHTADDRTGPNGQVSRSGVGR